MEDQFIIVTEFCEKHNIQWINASIENYTKAVRFQLNADYTTEDFLELAQSLSIKLLIVDIDRFYLNNYGITERTFGDFEYLEGKEGQIHHLRVYFTYDGFLYELEQIEDWFFKNIDNYNQFLSLQKDAGVSNMAQIEKQLLEIAEDIASQLWYFKLNTRRNAGKKEALNYIAEKYPSIDEKEYDFIEDRAHYMVETKYRKQHIAELKLLIQSLLQKGLSKPSIINSLGITEGMFYKYSG